MREFADARVRRVGALVLILAATGMVTSFGGSAGAITGGSISPQTLSSSGQSFTVNYTGKDPAAVNNLFIFECIADDSKVGFNTEIDCSPLSRQDFFGVPAPAGTVTYGGDPNNVLAPFVGIDPNNSEWSLCAPDSGAGVTNYQSGFFRLADSPADEADDFFIPFGCSGSPPTTTNPTTTTTTAPAVTTTTAAPVTTTTTPFGTTTTTLGDGTTTTTLGGDTTTTTTPDGTTTTTAPDTDPGTVDGSSGDGSGLDGTSADVLARTGTNAVQLVKLALLLVYAGWFFRKWGRPRRGKGLA